jgi:hypothetical protein
MNRGVKAWQLPPRLITGVYFLNAGLSKRGADDATAGQLHGFAVGISGAWQAGRQAVHHGQERRRPQHGSDHRRGERHACDNRTNPGSR